MVKQKLNCKAENYACGRKCQPKRYKCPSEKAAEINRVTDKFVKILPDVSPRKEIASLVPGPEEALEKFRKKLGLAALDDKQRFNKKFLYEAVNNGFDNGLLLKEVTSELDKASKNSSEENSKLLKISETELAKLVDMNIPVNGKVLGEGVQGKAYLVPIAGEEYVVKEGEIRNEEIEILNLLKEKKIKNVIKLIGVGELKEGKSLKFGKLNLKNFLPRRMVMNRIKGKAVVDLSPEEKEKVRGNSPQIFKLVKEIHEAGVAHKDLHNGNIFVEEDGNINLLDFGLAKKEASNKDKFDDMAKLVQQKWENKNEKEILEFFKNVLGLDASVEDLMVAFFGYGVGSFDFDRDLLWGNPEIFKQFQEIYFKGY